MSNDTRNFLGADFHLMETTLQFILGKNNFIADQMIPTEWALNSQVTD